MKLTENQKQLLSVLDGDYTEIEVIEGQLGWSESSIRKTATALLKKSLVLIDYRESESGLGVTAKAFKRLQ